MPTRRPAKKSVKKPARRSAKAPAAKPAKTHATTPADVDRLFGEHVNAGDLDALVDLYEADAALGQLDGTAVRGRRAIRQALNGLSAAQAKIEMNVVKVVEGGSDVAVLMNDGNRSFRSIRIAAGDTVLSVAAADFDGDGRPDLAVASGKSISIHLRRADGSYADARSKTRQEVRQEARQEVSQDACREAREDTCHDARGRGPLVRRARERRQPRRAG